MFSYTLTSRMMIDCLWHRCEDVYTARFIIRERCTVSPHLSLLKVFTRSEENGLYTQNLVMTEEI
jgi:hypothetical protein